MDIGKRRESVAAWAMLIVPILGATPAGACTVCDSATGREVRQELMGGDVALHLLATALPFAAVGAVVAAVHFGVPFSRKGGRDGNIRR